MNIFEFLPVPDEKCELCGAMAELRPYGPNRERICHPCGLKDRATTERQMAASPHFQALAAAVRGADTVIVVEKDLSTLNPQPPALNQL